MKVEQLTEEQYLILLSNALNETDVETLDFGGLLTHKTSNGVALIQSALESKYLLITQD